jgi:pimeloyl-ACP methyl ester carboxylesterase
MKTQQKLIRSYFKTLSGIAPGIAAAHAFRLFQTTRKKPMSEEETKFYKRAERYIICREKEDLIAYQMGNPYGELVFLIHGWESNAGSMAGIAYALVQCGYNVISFDLPAHGNSRLKRTNLIECSRAFEDLLNYFKPQNFSVISHSFGSAVTTYTLSRSGFTADRLVYLTSPDQLLDIFEGFRRQIDLGDKAYHYFLKRAEQIIPESLEELGVSNMLKKTGYKDLLLIHDKMDKMIPYEYSRQMALLMNNTSLKTFENIGHYRMLWNTEVILAILQEWQRIREAEFSF